MKKKIVLLIALSLTAVMLFAGCKKDEQPAEGEIIAEDVDVDVEEEVTVTVTPTPTPTPTESAEPTPTPEPTLKEEAEKPVVSPEEMEEAEKPEVTSPIEENVVIDPAIAADELGKSEENMLAIMDALNMCMAEQGYVYDVNDAEFFWTALAYTIGNYPDIRDNESNGTLTYNEDGYYKVHYNLVQEYATGIFADYSDLPEMPEMGMIERNADTDYYNFSVGERGGSYGNLTSWKNNGDGSYTAVTQLQSREDNSVIATYEYVLVKNSYADSIMDPMFQYAVKSVKEK